ncbi:hypothetical protein [Rhodopseudomonas sp. B29]|uniref:hypothetical protein n=1 Tax=Rhodopseudomonas sp. B29 TaxID=95607 RepID=UPI0003B37103|nr:hypothetical protein [Rhodopseudomonas sp. B29]
MTAQPQRRPSVVARGLAAIVLTSIYCFSFVGGAAVISGVTSTAAHAQRGEGRGRGRGYGRGHRGYGGPRGRGGGWNRGRGGGRGYGRCVVNAAGVRICL